MKTDIKKVWQILNRKEQTRLLLVSVLQIFSGIMDMLGVVSVVPFLSVAADQTIIERNEILNLVQNWLGCSSENFVIILGLTSIGILIINQIVRLFSGWYGQFVMHQIWWALHKRMFDYYLNQPYSFHIENSSSVLLEKLQIRVNAAVAGVISPIFLLITSFFSILFMVGFLFWNEPKMTFALFAMMGTFYILIYQKIRDRLDFYGNIGPEYSKKSFALVSEAFGAIKEIKVRNNSQTYLNLFDPLAKVYCDSQVKIQLFGAIPGGIAEVIAFGGILLITIMLMSTSSDLNQAIPLLGMYTLSLRRILPSIQNMYYQIARIRFHKPSLEVIYEDLFAALSLDPIDLQELELGEHNFAKSSIELKNITFSYPGAIKKAIDSISFTILNGSMIGIAGSSGAGKTTLVDILLGLYKTQEGTITVDSTIIEDINLSGWQKNLGYVPQSAFIADGTIARNIGFGIPERNINMKRVKEVAAIAQISDFIEKELPEQYETFVGERGIRLSGGQKQRLSIARALYYNPNILILDEATSALDGINEQMIMNSIKKLAGEKTIIIIAHRLTTLKECDNILFMDNGRLVDQGNYKYLMENNLTFKRMARDEEKNQ